jgi:hypothetical protein
LTDAFLFIHINIFNLSIVFSVSKLFACTIGAVPILVVCTSADFSSGMITPEEVDDLLFFHGLDRSSLRILENWNTRTPMLKSSSENLEKLHSQLFEWIDNNA